jgi:hypothetical protein
MGTVQNSDVYDLLIFHVTCPFFDNCTKSLHGLAHFENESVAP